MSSSLPIARLDHIALIEADQVESVLAEINVLLLISEPIMATAFSSIWLFYGRMTILGAEVTGSSPP